MGVFVTVVCFLNSSLENDFWMRRTTVIGNGTSVISEINI